MMANPYMQPNYQSGYFQPNYFQPQMPIGQPQIPVQGQQPPLDDRIWVASESAAEAFIVTANGFVRLWDSNKPVFYEKRTDAQGRPMPIVAYEYKIRDAGATPEAVSAGFEQRLSAVEERLNQLTEGKRDAKQNQRPPRQSAEHIPLTGPHFSHNQRNRQHSSQRHQSAQ